VSVVKTLINLDDNTNSLLMLGSGIVKFGQVLVELLRVEGGRCGTLGVHFPQLWGLEKG